MPAASPIAPLLGALRALETWLKLEGLDHVYIGGLAVALVGRPRITQDIDGIVLLGEMSIQEFLIRAKAAGFSTRVPDAVASTALRNTKRSPDPIRREPSEQRLKIELEPAGAAVAKVVVSKVEGGPRCPR